MAPIGIFIGHKHKIEWNFLWLFLREENKKEIVKIVQKKTQLNTFHFTSTHSPTPVVPFTRSTIYCSVGVYPILSLELYK